MEIYIDKQKKLARVWCSHADQNDENQQNKLKEFIAECKKDKIFVCVYNSGGGDLVENTKEILAYNYNNAVTRGNGKAHRDDAR